MIKELNNRIDIDIIFNRFLEDKIETAFRSRLNTDKLYYYYESCKGNSHDDECNNNHKTVWVGNVRLSKFIKKVKSKKYNAPVLMVTSSKTKSGIVESDFWKEGNVYWIGDVDRRHDMICCDRLFEELWRRIK